MTRAQFVAGVIPSRPLHFDPELAPHDLRAPVLFGEESSTEVDHSPLCNPADTQGGPSCGGNAVEAYAEWLLRRDCPEAELRRRLMERIETLSFQVDGDRLWREYRERFYKGDMSGGLTMDDIGTIPSVSGIFGSHEAREVAKKDRRLAMRDAPVVVGIALWPGYFNADRRTGYTKPGMPDPLAGHAVMQTASYIQRRNLFEGTEGSWGQNFGQYGFTLTNAEQIDYCQIDTGRQWFPVDPRWWETSTIWDYVIRHRG